MFDWYQQNLWWWCVANSYKIKNKKKCDISVTLFNTYGWILRVALSGRRIQSKKSEKCTHMKHDGDLFQQSAHFQLLMLSKAIVKVIIYFKIKTELCIFFRLKILLEV